MKPNKPTMENWIKEFDEKFVQRSHHYPVIGKPEEIKQFIKDLLAKHSQTKVEEESYTPEQIIQAYSIVLSKHGKMFMDELILELKRNFKTELKNTGGKE